MTPGGWLPEVAIRAQHFHALGRDCCGNAAFEFFDGTGFSVRFTNRDGELRAAWVAVSNIQIRQGQSGSTTIQDTTNPFVEARRAAGHETVVFNMSGTGGGSYRVIPIIELNPSSSLTP
jgi:hypothetical protein